MATKSAAANLLSHGRYGVACVWENQSLSWMDQMTSRTLWRFGPWACVCGAADSLTIDDGIDIVEARPSIYREDTQSLPHFYSLDDATAKNSRVIHRHGTEVQREVQRADSKFLRFFSMSSGFFDSVVDAVDFTGTWRLVSIDGDMEAALIDADWPWTSRMLARAAGFGVGLLSQHITHGGGLITIEFRGGRHEKAPVQQVQLSGIPCETVDECGQPVILSARWEGQILRMEGKTKVECKSVQPIQRYLQNNGTEMVQEVIQSDGARVKFLMKKEV